MERVVRELISVGRTIRVFVSIDFWPLAPIHAPVVHGMTQCERHSARNTLKHLENPLATWHPKGVKVLKINAPHTFAPDDCREESKSRQHWMA